MRAAPHPVIQDRPGPIRSAGLASTSLALALLTSGFLLGCDRSGLPIYPGAPGATGSPIDAAVAADLLSVPTCKRTFDRVEFQVTVTSAARQGFGCLPGDHAVETLIGDVRAVSDRAFTMNLDPRHGMGDLATITIAAPGLVRISELLSPGKLVQLKFEGDSGRGGCRFKLNLTSVSSFGGMTDPSVITGYSYILASDGDPAALEQGFLHVSAARADCAPKAGPCGPSVASHDDALVFVYLDACSDCNACTGTQVARMGETFQFCADTANGGTMRVRNLRSFDGTGDCDAGLNYAWWAAALPRP